MVVLGGATVGTQGSLEEGRKGGSTPVLAFSTWRWRWSAYVERIWWHIGVFSFNKGRLSGLDEGTGLPEEVQCRIQVVLYADSGALANN